MRHSPTLPYPTWCARDTAHSCEPAAADWSRYCTGCKRIGQTSVLDISVTERERERERASSCMSGRSGHIGLLVGWYEANVRVSSGPLALVNPFVTSGTYISTYKESFQVRWDNSIPLFLHAAIYLEVSLFR
jgi:hypothetical protein